MSIKKSSDTSLYIQVLEHRLTKFNKRIMKMDSRINKFRFNFIVIPLQKKYLLPLQHKRNELFRKIRIEKLKINSPELIGHDQ